MPALTIERLTEHLRLADELRSGRDHMLDPQDLPGRFGRVIRAVDHLLQALDCPAVVAGGWAVWRHGYVGRVTEDLDIVLPADRIDEFLNTASLNGFERLPVRPGSWPKVRHKESDVKVDILPEGATPGTVAHPAPTTIPHPDDLGAAGRSLRYISLHGLIELKLAAGRARDESDVVELIRSNPEQIESLREHLSNVHSQYLIHFDSLVVKASEQRDA
jgi:hypothetical protein